MFYKKDINHVFQPVFSPKQRKVIGYEALMRHDFFPQPDVIFQIARELDKLYLLDSLSIQKAIETFNFGYKGFLFLNIFPSTLLTSEFLIFLEEIQKYQINPKKIVFELNETVEEENIWNLPSLKNQISVMQKLGFLIALDDVGAGAASLKKIIEIQPDMIKLDRFFSVKLAESNSKQELLTFFVNFCKSQKSMLVLEGVEESVDFVTAERLDIPFVQGYYISKPLPFKQVKKKILSE
ncbi:hypothetical protein DCC39_11800 [Pueribacillus theae]|uniref:EAL domain-containing protein n=1 Tax=Pueribacillus theae TaxID=2171751 RepID=A0A2U1JY49_9BACI|nr:EAL domain-containing protein [Pueribacillus theae]PWA10072.1 hypothetical protein DCC39_11800 [Pueribacillus theae]